MKIKIIFVVLALLFSTLFLFFNIDYPYRENVLYSQRDNGKSVCIMLCLDGLFASGGDISMGVHTVFRFHGADISDRNIGSVYLVREVH